MNYLCDSTKIYIETFPKYLMLCLTNLDLTFFLIWGHLVTDVINCF